MPKEGEINYLKNLGEQGAEHAAQKPFSDPDCPQYLAEMGAVMLLLPKAPGTLLDLGCGAGWTSLFLAKHGFWVTGIDIAEDMIARANERKDMEQVDRVRFVAYDYERYGVEGEYDCALFFDALHHAEDEVEAIATAYRALKPGGVCVVTEPGIGHADSPGAVEARRKYGVTERDMPPETVIRAGRRVGFRKFDVYPHARGIHATLYGNPLGGFFMRGLVNMDFVKVTMVLLKVFLHKRRSGIVVMRKQGER